jgi:protein SCO1/2
VKRRSTLLALLGALALWSACDEALAQARGPAAPPQMEFVQHPGAQLPLQTAFVDDDGRKVLLADLFGQKPVVLVPGYFRCPNLCSTVMQSVLQTFAAMALPAGSYRLVALSIDPTENAAVAAGKKAAYLSMLSGADLHLLTGAEGPIRAVMHVAGFHYAYDGRLGQYVHPAGFLVATPDGRISRYFMGVDYRRAELGRALRDAAAGKAGGPVERLLLLCAHYDPQLGRYTGTAMIAIRIACAALALLLGSWIWRHRRRYAQRRPR